MPSAREARVISLVETRLGSITTISSAPSQCTFFRFIPTQLKNESSPPNQPKTADLKSDGLLANKGDPRLCRGGSKSLTFEGVHQRNFQA